MLAAPVVWVANPILSRAPSSDLPANWPLRHVLTLLLVAMPVVVVILVGVIVHAALIWATGHLVRSQKIWQPAISLTTVAVLLLLYSWQGSTPKVETELMRSQVLWRLGHTAVADRIEESLLATAKSADD